MFKKELLFLSGIIILGLLDWLTTVIGVLFFGGTEINPLLSGLTRSSMVLFSAAKIAAVVLGGILFYKAIAISKLTQTTEGWNFTGRFLDGGCMLTLLILVGTVANNATAILSL
jgi:hypothetical protein